MKRMVYLGLTVLFSSMSALAYNFSEADGFFAARENNPANLKKAEDLYQSALGQVSGRELLYAVEQLGKVYYYWGDLLTPDSNEAARKTIFGRCRNMVERAHPSKVGDNPQYFYWKSACLALWGKSAGLFEKMAIKDELVRTMEDGFQRSDNYEGGGVHRVATGVYIRSANVPFVGLYDVDKASYHVNKAIEMDKENKFYNAYVLKAEVLVAQGKSDEAQELLEDKKAELDQRIAAHNLPADVSVESKVISKHMAAMLSGF